MKLVRTIGIVSGGGEALGLNPVTPFDRALGNRLGVAATDLVAKQHFGRMVCLKDGKIDSMTLDEALEQMKHVDPGCASVHAARAVGATFGDSA